MTTVIKDGQRVAPTCTNCGCRLQEISANYWTHFGTHPWLDTDARGCKCLLVHNSFHISEGKVITDVTLVG